MTNGLREAEPRRGRELRTKSKIDYSSDLYLMYFFLNQKKRFRNRFAKYIRNNSSPNDSAEETFSLCH